MTVYEDIEHRAKTGDAIFFRYSNPFSAAVRWFMNYGRKEGTAKCPFNHCGILVWDDGYWWVYESSGGYIRRIKLKNRKLKAICVKRYSGNIEADRIKFSATKYQGSSKYDYAGLIPYQMALQLFGWWPGSTGDKASKKMYCGEYNAKVYDETLGIFPEWWLTDPEDIYNHRKFGLIYTNYAGLK